jgi:hypothetical protein
VIEYRLVIGKLSKSGSINRFEGNPRFDSDICVNHFIMNQLVDFCFWTDKT